MQLLDFIRNTKATVPFSMVPKGHLWLVGSLCAALAVMSMLPSKQAMATRQVETIALPTIEAGTALPPQPEDIIEQPAIHNSLPKQLPAQDPSYSTASESQQDPSEIIALRQHSESVKKGDNLALIFKRAGLTYQELHAVLSSSKESEKLKSIYPGHKLDFSIDSDNQLHKLVYTKSKLHSYSYTRKGDRFVFADGLREPDIITSSRGATITDSLFLAGKTAQLDDKILMELANIFGWDVDFALEVREGDSFRLLYEELYLDGEKIGNGNILAAEFTNRGKTYRAVRYVNEQGDANYFTPEGDTLRKEFLRSPIDFARISSHFNLRRKHPVLNTIRAHKGTDYAAAHGTPIKATGDGKVTFAGRKGGYGNVVIIQHGQKYKTLYAHVSRYANKIKAGARVKQGQVIAYVGSTGLATGPHLHYEFYENGAVRNPARVRLPKAQSISKTEKTRFMAQTRTLLAQFWPDSYPLQVVENDTPSNES